MEATAPTTATPTQRRFTVAEYHRMAEAGILHEDDRVELLNGRLYAMPPIGSSHASRVDRLNRLFVLRAEDRATVRVQNPIQISTDSEPVPDLALVDPNDEAYRERHPRPEEVLLVVEVADTTEAFDRSTKLSLYAQAGLSEYWVVSLPNERVYVHREPTGDEYGLRLTRPPGDSVTVAALPDLDPIPVDEILGT